MSTFQKKIQISIGASFLFLIINLPQTYNLTNKLLPWEIIENGCPTRLGLLTHTLLFFIIRFLEMGNSKFKTCIKLKISLYGTLIFYILSNPVTYSFVSSLFGNQFAENGCPTLMDVLLHTIVYCVFLIVVMYLSD
jgi:hypothetical protein